jgi:GAF domain-containing protein
MHQQLNPVLKAVSDAVLAVASNLSVDEVLQRLVDSARELAGARYAALGIPDGEGGFRRFLVSGMTDELIARMGPLPRTHGVLGAILEEPGPYRTEDIQADARFRGWWPRGHPDMHSMLGVPSVSTEGTIGAFYLTEKEGADAFDAEDQELIEVLAAHAAIAITNARLYERSRELSIVSERNRLALELDGLEETLRKEVAMLGRVHGMDIDLRIDGRFESSAEHHRELAILRIATRRCTTRSGTPAPTTSSSTWPPRATKR